MIKREKLWKVEFIVRGKKRNVEAHSATISCQRR